MKLSDKLTYCGLVLAIGSYFLGTEGHWNFDSLSYQLVQVLACLCMFTAAYLIRFKPYMVFNVCWAAIAVAQIGGYL